MNDNTITEVWIYEIANKNIILRILGIIWPRFSTKWVLEIVK